MELNITYKKINDEDQTIVKLNRLELKIYEGSPDWSTPKINEFLIKMVSSISEDEVIEIKYDEDLYKEGTKLVHNHIVDLFQEFLKEYNEESKKLQAKFK